MTSTLLLRRWILIHVHETVIYRSECPQSTLTEREKEFLKSRPQPASKRRMIYFQPPTLQKSSSIILRNIFRIWKPRCIHSKRPGSFTTSAPRKISYAPFFMAETLLWMRIVNRSVERATCCTLLLTSYENLFIKENFLCGVAFPALVHFIGRETFDCQRRLYFMSNDVSLPIFIKKLWGCILYGMCLFITFSWINYQ